MRTIDSVIASLPSPAIQRLPAPEYTGASSCGLGLAVESMKRHMTDEGWQIMDGLEQAGYQLAGHRLRINDTDVRRILARTDAGVVLLQDKREWDVRPRCFRDPSAAFTHYTDLAAHPELFKLTILKDAHQNPPYHRASAHEIGCHAWVIYYHPRIVHHLAPFARPQHLVRTYHSVYAGLVPDYSPEGRNGCLLSGAVSNAYPLRQRLIANLPQLLPNLTILKHPGYHMNGSATPGFLRTLARFKVAICTASIYGYALRKIIEATACGCVVVTDLPSDEVLPEIDGNLIRVDSTASVAEVADVVSRAMANYDPELQRCYSDLARIWYDYRAVTRRLADDIEMMRRGYVAA